MKAPLVFKEGRIKLAKGGPMLFQLEKKGQVLANVYLGENGLVVEGVHKDNERSAVSLMFDQIAEAGYKLTAPKKK